MTLATDQNKEPTNLSPTSQRMLALRDVVLLEWETRVRALVNESSKLPQPILMDTLPSFYDNIAESVTQDSSRITGADGTTLASEHGGERARMTKLDPRALITEYQIFRSVIFDVLHQNDVLLTHTEALTINASIDVGICEAVTAFSFVHTALRQQFIAALAHDLRGPLATAHMALELILMEPDPANIKNIVIKGIGNLSRMDRMIQDLLDSMTFQSGERMQLKITNFDISDVVKEVQVHTAATHAVRFQTFGSSVRGWWDIDVITRAIENLVNNAVKYGDMARPIRISFAESYERLILMVHNEGQPIPLEEQEHVFQIFRRAQSAKEGKTRGWGIGLPFVRGVAESHGGSVMIDSTAERGTTFTLDIPKDSRPFQNAPTLAQPS